ncbi:MAG: hypothetical protein EP335_01845 [Alphaproteobacteria bacterium]|nr:MAG: hypothetical protein EP335_01845 [Alphaproteobacteria bacterium]
MSDDTDSDFSYADDEELVGQFLSWTEGALKELREIVDTLGDDAPKAGPAAERIYDLSHNIKGMGASFNYSLMTSAGTSLCAYIKGLPDGASLSKRVVDAHVRVYEVVLEHRIRGDGGERGQALVTRLGAIIAEEQGI